MNLLPCSRVTLLDGQSIINQDFVYMSSNGPSSVI